MLTAEMAPFVGVGSRIIADVADRGRICPRSIHKPGRESWRVRARWEVWFLMCVQYGWSLPRAAQLAGRADFDHTTVLYGIRKLAHERYGLDMAASIYDIRCAWGWYNYAKAMEGVAA